MSNENYLPLDCWYEIADMSCINELSSLLLLCRSSAKAVTKLKRLKNLFIFYKYSIKIPNFQPIDFCSYNKFNSAIIQTLKQPNTIVTEFLSGMDFNIIRINRTTYGKMPDGVMKFVNTNFHVSLSGMYLEKILQSPTQIWRYNDMPIHCRYTTKSSIGSFYNVHLLVTKNIKPFIDRNHDDSIYIRDPIKTDITIKLPHYKKINLSHPNLHIIPPYIRQHQIHRVWNSSSDSVSESETDSDYDSDHDLPKTTLLETTSDTTFEAILAELDFSDLDFSELEFSQW